MVEENFTHQVGETIEYGKIRVAVAESDECIKCYFNKSPMCPSQSIEYRKIFGDCSGLLRTDGKSTIFKQLQL